MRSDRQACLHQLGNFLCICISSLGFNTPGEGKTFAQPSYPKDTPKPLNVYAFLRLFPLFFSSLSYNMRCFCPPLYYERSFLLAHSSSVREGEEGLNEYIVMANDKMGVSRCNLAC